MSDSTTQLASTPLLVGAAGVGALLGVSTRKVWDLHQMGMLPLPIKLGARTLWRVKEMTAWVDAGCPSRERWMDAQKS